MTDEHAGVEPPRADDAVTGPTLVVFGGPWCGRCRAALPLLD